MFRAVQRRAPMALAAAGAIAVAIAGTGSTVAQASDSSGPVWGTPTTSVGSATGLFESAVCPGAGVCVAAGAAAVTSATSPEVAAEAGGVWGAPSFAVVSGISSEDALFTSIACMSATSCVGVGYNSASAPSTDTPFVDTVTVSRTAVSAAVASTPSISSLPQPNANEEASLASVSCTSSACTAVGSYLTNGNVQSPFEAIFANGSWSVAAVAAPAAAVHGADLTAVSCPAAGACEAVGNYVDSSNDERSWAIQLDGTATPQLISAPADAVAQTGSIPSVPAILNNSGGQVMTAVSCPSAGVCTAAGQYLVSGGSRNPMAISIGDGAPGTPAALPLQSAAPLTAVTGIWCADAEDCAIVGDAESSAPLLQPVTASEASGSWSPLTPPPGSGPTATSEMVLIGLGCTSVELCMAPGVEVSSSAGYVPLADFSAPPLSLTTSSLPAATVGAPYSATLQSAGGTGTSTWTLSGSLPAGLTLNAATGVISGTPTTTGTDGFGVQLASAGPPAQSASVSLSITVAAAPVVPAPKLSFGSPKVTASGVTLSLGCSGSGTCSGKVVLTAVEHLKGRRVTAVTARVRKRTVKLTLARGSYSLTAGQLGKVTLKLTSRAKTLLERLHKISGRLALTPTGASKPSITRTVTFKSAARKRR